MSFKLALAQCSYLDYSCLNCSDLNGDANSSGSLSSLGSSDLSDLSVDAFKESALDTIKSCAARAAKFHADIIVFPEYMMCPYDILHDKLISAAEPLSGNFVTNICATAKENKIWIACSVNEYSPKGLPYNAVVLIDSNGEIQSSYNKVHLFDSYQCKESDKFTAGNELFTPVRAPFATLGLGICYDLRFPDVARTQCVAGAEVMLYPAAWMRGKHKVEQWHALLKCRAIENTAFVAGICRADSGYIGNTCVYGPNGELLALANQSDCLLIVDIDTDSLPQIRKNMPVLDCARAK